MSEAINIQFTRFSAFYSPLIATIAGGFLKEEGLQPKHSIAPVGKSAIDGVVAGTAHVCQSAPSQGFGPLEKGETPPAVHFAQMRKDGFFLTGRAAVGLHLGQAQGEEGAGRPRGPAARVFKYILSARARLQGVGAVGVPSAQMGVPPGAGRVHPGRAGPRRSSTTAPGVVASVGEAIGPCAFSASRRRWLGTDMAKRFMRVSGARLIATRPPRWPRPVGLRFERPRAVITSTIALSKLGCWTPHRDHRPAFEVALDLPALGADHWRHRYEDSWPRRPTWREVDRGTAEPACPPARRDGDRGGSSGPGPRRRTHRQDLLREHHTRGLLRSRETSGDPEDRHLRHPAPAQEGDGAGARHGHRPWQQRGGARA